MIGCAIIEVLVVRNIKVPRKLVNFFEKLDILTFQIALTNGFSESGKLYN